MKTALFFGAALLGLACTRPALAQVLPSTTTMPTTTAGTPIAPGTVAPGQPGTLSPTTGVVPGAATTTLGTAPITGSPAAGSLRGNQPVGVPQATPRSTRGTSRIPRATRTTTTPATNPLRP